MTDKVVVYMGDRRIYDMLVIAAKSLLHNTKVNRLYFLTDDPVFPQKLPKMIQCVNVHDQPYFPRNCPNIHPHYSYMTLMRSVLSKVLPFEHRVLLLDPDTIVLDDISPIWDTNIDNCFFAAVQETRNNDHERKPYYNAGVMYMNLDLFRNEYIDDTIIQSLNTHRYKHLEQDALNFICSPRILPIDSCYNASFVSDPTDHARIRHFLSFDKKYWPEYAKPYQAMPWEDIAFSGMKGAN